MDENSRSLVHLITNILDKLSLKVNARSPVSFQSVRLPMSVMIR